MRFPSGSFAVVFAVALGSGDSLPSRVLDAQTPVHTTATRQWTVARDPFVDLWFHSLAVLGYDGYGPLSLYDARYAERVHDAKARTHLTTTLDHRAPELRRALVADSAFELLHFLPLYFVGEEPSVVLSALRAAVRETRSGLRAGSLISAANAIAAALPTAHERDVFVSLLDAVDDEWTTFFRAERASSAAEDRRATRVLQSAWDNEFASALDGYLVAMGMARGTILVSPAVGSEGRIVRDAGGTTIVAVSSGPVIAGDDDAALLRAVREIAFPLLDRLHAPLIASASRVAAGRARDAAAVRAGAIVLDVVDASLAARYRRLFIDAIGGRAFDAAYPLSSEAAMELRRLVTSAAGGAVPGRTSYEDK